MLLKVRSLQQTGEITIRFPGEYIPSSTDHMIDDFTEWHAGAQTIRLHKFFDLFLVIY